MGPLTVALLLISAAPVYVQDQQPNVAKAGRQEMQNAKIHVFQKGATHDKLVRSKGRLKPD